MVHLVLKHLLWLGVYVGGHHGRVYLVVLLVLERRLVKSYLTGFAHLYFELRLLCLLLFASRVRRTLCSGLCHFDLVDSLVEVRSQLIVSGIFPVRKVRLKLTLLVALLIDALLPTIDFASKLVLYDGPATLVLSLLGNELLQRSLKRCIVADQFTLRVCRYRACFSLKSERDRLEVIALLLWLVFGLLLDDKLARAPSLEDSLLHLVLLLLIRR